MGESFKDLLIRETKPPSDNYNARGNFDIDLKKAHIREDFVRALLVEKSVEKETIYFEVKSDSVMGRTGKLFFEFKFKGKRSGLSISGADWVCVTIEAHDNNVIMFFELQYIKKLVRRLYKEKKAEAITTYNKAEGYLVSAETLLTAGEKLTTPYAHWAEEREEE